MTRAIWTGFKMHFKMLSRGGLELSVVTFWPIVYATLGTYVYRSGEHPKSLFYVSLGSTMMAVWSMTTATAGDALQASRELGTLELAVAAPVPFVAVLAPVAIGAASVGIYAFATTIVFGRIAYGIPITVEHPLLFVVSIPVAIMTMGVLGLLLASLVVVYREAHALASTTEYPVWIACGLLLPVALLPAWVHPVSWVLAPTWGMGALRTAALGGPIWRDLLLAALTSLASVGLTAVALANFERLARRRGTLALA
jgi:ABC-2 type transport system permease protein